MATPNPTPTAPSNPNPNPDPDPDLGNLVRLLPLSLADLPFHPSLPLSPTTTSSPPTTTTSSPSPIPSQSRPPLPLFLRTLLSEAHAFIRTTVPTTFVSTSSGEKSSAPSAAKVLVQKRYFSPEELGPRAGAGVRRSGEGKAGVAGEGENWFVRKSRHENKKGGGTLDWEELDDAVRVEHNEHEREYTAEVFDSYKVLDWEGEMGALGLGGKVEGFEDVKMRIYEMCHKFPFPLSTRVFPVLVVTAKTGPTESIIVHVPVDIRDLPEAFYSNGRNLKEGDSEIKRKKAVIGAYTSIEHAYVVPDDGGTIEWSMAVASDTKGSVPMSLQKLGVPGAIVKDVGLVMKWVSGKRKAGG